MEIKRKTTSLKLAKELADNSRPPILRQELKKIYHEGRINLDEIRERPQLSAILREQGEAFVLTAVTALVDRLVGSVKVKEKPNEVQIVDIAEDILDEYWYIRLEEIALAFKLARQGKIMKFYNRIDEEIIFRILNEYWANWRMTTKEQSHEDQKTLSDGERQNPKNPFTGKVDKIIKRSDGYKNKP